MTEKGSGCNQPQKALVVGVYDKVEPGGGRCSRREGHFVDCDYLHQLRIWVSINDGNAKGHGRHSWGLLYGNNFLSTTHKSRKWKREIKCVFCWYNKCTTRSVFWEPCALTIPLWAVISHFAYAKCTKNVTWGAIWNYTQGTACDGLPLRWRKQHLETVWKSWAAEGNSVPSPLQLWGAAEWWGGNILTVKTGRVY